MPIDHYGEDVAARYDEVEAARFRPDDLDPTVDLLAALAGPGPALELAIGTGRVALPLRARGIEVHGIDLSPAMVARLRAKPGGTDLPVTVGDMATLRLPERFTLVYVVFNSLTNLLTQDEQVACVANAAAHLVPGGCFVAEVFVPALRRLPPGDRFVPFSVTEEHVGIDEYDVVEQTVVSHHLWTMEDGSIREASFHRYAWPAELDLMARMAGLHLEHRWASWRRDPFTAASTDHVSVWRSPRAGSPGPGAGG